MSKPNLTLARLREVLHYEPSTGVFTWRLARGSRAAGAVAGTLDKDGYRQIQVDGKLYKAHRLAWLYVHGKWPGPQLDHRDGRTDNNRIKNLRDATRGVNAQNRRAPGSTNTTGFLGVSRTASGKFRASIKTPGIERRVHLGSFEQPEPAHIVYLMAKREMHEGCTI